MTFRQKTMAKLGKEPATPGYTGYIPSMRNHLIGHTYGDSTRRAAACTDSLRHKEYPKAIELTVESRPQDRNFFYAQLSRAALEEPPKAIRWICSKRDLPPDMDATSGLMDIRKMKTCIGTTPAGVTKCDPHMSIPDAPYKDRKICTRREFEKLKDDVLEVAEARHHIKGYSGHTHAKQHIYGKSYGKTTRTLRPLPADPRTSREFVDYADSRALVVNEFELKQAGLKPKMRYNHFTLLAPGHKPGGPGIYVEGNLEESQGMDGSSATVSQGPADETKNYGSSSGVGAEAATDSQEPVLGEDYYYNCECCCPPAGDTPPPSRHPEPWKWPERKPGTASAGPCSVQSNTSKEKTPGFAALSPPSSSSPNSDLLGSSCGEGNEDHVQTFDAAAGASRFREPWKWPEPVGFQAGLSPPPMEKRSPF